MSSSTSSVGSSSSATQTAGRRLALAVDGSKNSMVAADWALKFARPNDTIHILHAQQNLETYVVDTTTNELDLATQRHTEQKSKQVLEQVLDKCSKANRSCVAQSLPSGVGSSAVGQAIVNQLEQLHAHTVVMGSHGYTGLKRAFLGSVANYVLEQAPCNVAVVKYPPGATVSSSSSGGGSLTASGNPSATFF